MKLSKRQQEIEARRAADPLAQAIGRDDIDYSTDELPTAPRSVAPTAIRISEFSEVNPWDELESMIEDFVTKHLPNGNQRQAIIPIRDFVFDRTTEGKSSAPKPKETT